MSLRVGVTHAVVPGSSLLPRPHPVRRPSNDDLSLIVHMGQAAIDATLPRAPSPTRLDGGATAIPDAQDPALPQLSVTYDRPSVDPSGRRRVSYANVIPAAFAIFAVAGFFVAAVVCAVAADSPAASEIGAETVLIALAGFSLIGATAGMVVAMKEFFSWVERTGGSGLPITSFYDNLI